MLLKSLRLRGFKSFADRTDLDMLAGITCVVGPNGSGKSNVVDALLWVLGAQAARQMRGGRMEDVIFSGTPERPALGRAEVELVIDNTSGAIPVDFPEIAIGRLLFRSGESRYTINREPCRLSDVVELLSDSGVGRQMHNVVGQGRIDAILTAQPEERRVTIEEAAGVLKHRRRRERALRRLEGVDADLVRLEDVERELLRRLRPLERQVKGAERHQALSTELAALSLWRAGEHIRQRRIALDAAAVDGTRLREDVTRLRGDQEALATDLVATDAVVRTASDAVDAARSLRERFDRLTSRFQALAQVATERRRGIERRRAAIRLQRSTEGVANVETRQEATRRELEAVAAAEAELAGSAVRHETDSLDHKAAEAELEAEWHAAGLDRDDRHAALAAQLASAAAALQRSEAERRRLSERAGELRRRHAEAGTSADPGSTPDDGDLREARRRLRLTESLRSRAEAEAHCLSELHRRATARAASSGARAESLAAAAVEDDGGRRAIAALESRYGALTRFRDVLAVEKGAERAVIAALGPLPAAVVLPPGVAPEAVEAVKSVPEGVIVLASDASDTPDASDTKRDMFRPESLVRHGCLALHDVVRLRPGRGRPLVRALLHRHAAGVYVCRTAPHALSMSTAHPDCTFVTVDGDRFAGGVLTVRSPEREERLEPVLGAAEAAREAASARRHAAAIEARLVGWQAELRRLRDDERTRARALADLEAARRALGEALRRAARDRADAADELSVVEGQLLALGERIAVETARHDELRRRVDGAAPGASEQERQVLEVRRRVLEEARASLRRESLRMEGERAKLTERRRALTSRLADLGALHERAAAAAVGMDRSESALETRDERLAALLDVVRDAHGEALRRREHASARVDTLSQRRNEALARSDALHGQADVLARRDTEHRDALRTAELAEAEARLRLEAAEAVPRHELHVTAEAALAAQLPEVHAGADFAAIDSRIESVERELRRLGPVNPLAVEEHGELAARRAMLDSELGDVRKAKREIGKIVRQVDDKIREVLDAAYIDVGRHFADFFAVLFPGGEGRIVLTDPGNILETGIEIEARPSGKSAKRLSLLSGGERSLAALAFLFAVFRARPSPFYVLDEVEAALDDVNLHRFCNLLREFRGDSQLFVVTHQKRTMETADVLYGVSLGADGTTRVLSQRIADLDLVG